MFEQLLPNKNKITTVSNSDLALPGDLNKATVLTCLSPILTAAADATERRGRMHLAFAFVRRRLAWGQGKQVGPGWQSPLLPSRPVQCTHGEARSDRLICLHAAHVADSRWVKTDISNVRHAIQLVDALRSGRAKEREVARPTTGSQLLHCILLLRAPTKLRVYRTVQNNSTGGIQI
jgi:hypothetical protein